MRTLHPARCNQQGAQVYFRDCSHRDVQERVFSTPLPGANEGPGSPCPTDEQEAYDSEQDNVEPVTVFAMMMKAQGPSGQPRPDEAGMARFSPQANRLDRHGSREDDSNSKAGKDFCQAVEAGIGSGDRSHGGVTMRGARYAWWEVRGILTDLTQSVNCRALNQCKTILEADKTGVGKFDRVLVDRESCLSILLILTTILAIRHGLRCRSEPLDVVSTSIPNPGTGRRWDVA